MLFVALSCLQGRPMAHAFDELARLDPGGIQLTPGNLPTPAFEAHVARASASIATRRHHGFTFTARKTDTWSRDGACVVTSESVHPPRTDDTAPIDAWRAWYAGAPTRPILEIMYPGYALGTGDEIDRAMADHVELAVDISHAFIQRTAGVMTDAQWRRLCEYDRIAEVHVSANRGTFDAHHPIAADTFGLVWARARLAAGTPVVLECYMHKLAIDARRAQVDLIRA